MKKKMSKVLRSKETGLYLAGWDVFGQPKYINDIKLADNMNHPTALRVAENLKTVFNAGEFEMVPSA